MKNKIRFFTFFLLIILSVNLYAQEVVEDNSVLDKLSVSVEMGTSIGRYNNSNFFTNYAIPSFYYPVNSRFSVQTSFMYSQSNFGITNLFEQSNYTAVRNYVFTQGSYQVNDRLIIRGDVIYGNNNFNSDYINNFSSFSYSIGADFIISKNITIGVQFRQTQNVMGNNGIEIR